MGKDGMEDLIYQKLCNGELLTIEEQEYLYEYLYDSNILELEDNGWVAEMGIFHLKNRYWQGIYYWNDMSGTEFDKDTIFREVELKPVTRMDWVVKNPD